VVGRVLKLSSATRRGADPLVSAHTPGRGFRTERITGAAVALVVSVAAGAAGEWASDAAAPAARSYDAASLRSFVVIRDPSLDRLIRPIYLHGFTRGRALREHGSRSSDRRQIERCTA